MIKNCSEVRDFAGHAKPRSPALSILQLLPVDLKFDHPCALDLLGFFRRCRNLALGAKMQGDVPLFPATGPRKTIFLRLIADKNISCRAFDACHKSPLSTALASNQTAFSFTTICPAFIRSAGPWCPYTFRSEPQYCCHRPPRNAHQTAVSHLTCCSSP